MPDAFFIRNLVVAPEGVEPVLRAIREWEAPSSPDGGVLGPDGAPLPPLAAPGPGRDVFRRGRLAASPHRVYRLRLSHHPANGSAGLSVDLLLGSNRVDDPAVAGGGRLMDRLLAVAAVRDAFDDLPFGVRTVTDDDDVDALLARLLDPNRRFPCLVTTVRAKSERAVVDPERLAEHVRGMAEVWHMVGRASTFALRKRLDARGLDRRWNCYDGGVRLYLPGFDPERDALADHPLKLADQIAQAKDPTAAALRWALPTILRALDVDGWKQRWRAEAEPTATRGRVFGTLGQLEDLRRLLGGAEGGAAAARGEAREVREPPQSAPAAREASSAAMEDAAPAPDGPTGGTPGAIRSEEGTAPDRGTGDGVGRTLQGAAREPRALRIVPDDGDAATDLYRCDDGSPGATATLARGAGASRTIPAHADPMGPAPASARRFDRMKASLREAFDVLAEMEEDLDELERELRERTNERDELARERDELAQKLQDLRAEDDASSGGGTVAGILARYARLAADRLRITPYALRKAETSRFADLDLLERVLAILIATGPDFGRVSEAAKAVLGRRVRARPKESPATMARFGERRSFPVDGGARVAVEQHLTLGHGARNLHETLQIYWRAAGDEAVEIVYAGPHLPTVSENT